MRSDIGYWSAVGIGAVLCVVSCVVARRYPGPPAQWTGRLIAIVLVADAVVFVVRQAVDGGWTARTSLPLNLCDVALVVAAIACWFPRWQLGVELTYFWGLAGTLQGVVTPDLGAGFPDAAFFVFVVGHVGIVVAALYLVVGLRLQPRSGTVTRVLAITAVYAAIVGVVDWLADANYMYLAHAPERTSLLSILGPWPWYIVSAAGVAVVLFLLLDAPFRLSRSHNMKLN